MYTFGENTIAVILKKNGNELHHTFVVADSQTIEKAQPVKLTNDGKITPLASGDNYNLCIGNALNKATAGEQCTVYLRGRIVAQGTTPGSLNAGPVQLDTTPMVESPMQSAVKIPSVIAAAATDVDHCGWALNSASEDGSVLVLFKH